MKKLLYVLFLFTISHSYSQCWQKVITGFGHTFSIQNDGSLWTWGSNGSGQLGIGSYSAITYPIIFDSTSQWIELRGYLHSLGIKTNGTLWAWGRNDKGQLGDGTNITKNFPTQIGLSNDWIKISASHHSLAIKSNGTLWAWGYNNRGQLGDGTLVAKNSPLQIGNETNWSKISSGVDYSIALKSNGTLWAWGSNDFGQLGDSSKIDRSIPVQIGVSSDWNKIVSLGLSSFGIKNDSSLWAWGSNDFGQLGDSSNIERIIPTKIGVNKKWIKVAAGIYHTLGIQKNGTLWTWGGNAMGQLGDSTFINKNYPIQIGNDLDWVDISAGENYSMAVKSDGSLWAWGSNYGGRLGDSSTTNKYIPTLIKCSLSIIKSNKFAYLTFSKTIAYPGDTVRISGFNFPSNYADSVNIYNSKYETQFKIPFTASATGSFQVFKIIGSSEDGYNYVGAYDSVNKRNVAVERYEVVNATAPSTANRFLQIIVPQGNKFFDLQNNALMNILWKDKIYNTSKIVNKSANSTKSHTIEYKLNGGAWTVADTRTKLTTKGLLKSEQVFDYIYTFKQAGQYQFRVTETDNPYNWDTTSQLIVTNSADTNVFISKEWDYSAPKYNSNPFAICADGTARVYLKVKKKSNYPFDISQVKITATDADGLTTQSKYIGKLMATNNSQAYDTSANTATTTSATNTSKGYQDAYWFWYVAPDNFARELGDDYKGERTVNFTIEISYSNKPSEIYNTSIQIFRPPLMLVHGLGGDEHTWDEMELPAGLGKLKDAKNIFKAGIKANNMEKSASFFINAQILLHKPVEAENAVFANSFQANIILARKDGISSNRVDYVCHSMGGSMLRTAINGYPEDYYPKSGKFLNYNRGFVNKIITINTPHNGATTADFLNFAAPRFNTKLKSILFGGHLIGNYVLNDKVYTFFKPTKKFLGLPTEYGVTDAVSNLQHYNANQTTGGVRFSETKNVKAFLIGSTMFKDNNTLTLFDNDKILNIVFNIAANIDNVKKNPLQALDYLEGFFATRYNSSNFSLKSDWVVQIPSQLAGGDYANLKPNEFLVNGGLNSMHTKITSNYSVGNKVFDVLNKDILSSMFANSIPANPASGGLRVRSGELKPLDSVLEYFNDTSRFQLTTSILDNYRIDTNINFTINLKDTSNLKLVSFVFQGEVYEGNLSKGMNNYSIKVNSNHIDSQTFLISLKYDSLGYDVYHNYSKVIKVIPYNLPESLSINPELKMLNRREGYAPEIIANHGTFISNIALNNSDLIIDIADKNVVKYIDTLGRFVAGDSGSTYVALEYKGKRDTIYFAINPSIEEDNSPCIAPISSLNLIPNKLSITTENSSHNSSFFYWSFGDGTFSSEQTPTHTYAINGDYNICLTSYNPCDSHKVCKTISVCD